MAALPSQVPSRAAISTARRLRDFLASQEGAMVKLLERWVCLETPSFHAPSQERFLDSLGEALEGAGLRIRRISGQTSGGHLLARPRRRSWQGASQMLLGHCDTVWPLGTLDVMPWKVEGELLRGPGVYDMKGGLVQGVFALRALRALGLRPAVTPWFFVVSDEEVGSPESRRHLERLARHMDRVFVLEPSLGRDGKLKTSRKGVGRFEVRVRGRAAHAGLDPERGASAILELSYAIQELFALNDPRRGVTVNVGQVDGGLRPNVVAPESRAVVDVRIARNEDAGPLEEAILGLRARTPGVSIHVEGGIGRPPMEETPRGRRLFESARCAARLLGLEIDGGQAGGGSDGNFTSRLTATLDGLGAVGGGAHAHHEFIRREAMIERAALLAMLLLEPPLGPWGGSSGLPREEAL